MLPPLPLSDPSDSDPSSAEAPQDLAEASLGEASIQHCFHADLRQLLQKRGWTATRANQETGLGGSGVVYWLRTGGYPRDASLERLIEALDVPSETRARTGAGRRRR